MLKGLIFMTIFVVVNNLCWIFGTYLDMLYDKYKLKIDKNFITIKRLLYECYGDVPSFIGASILGFALCSWNIFRYVCLLVLKPLISKIGDIKLG